MNPLEAIDPTGSISSLFKLMEVCEEEIDVASEKHPDRKETIGALMPVLFPTPVLAGKAHDVYRHHCRELISRGLGKRPDFRPGTKAEVMCLLSRASLAAPLNQIGAGLYGQLFAEVFPNADVGTHPQEPWPGAFEEELHASRRAAAIHTRVLG